MRQARSFRNVVAGQFRDNGAVTENINPVAEFDFVHFGGVPDKGASIFGLVAQNLVDFLLRADIDATHRIVHQDGGGAGCQRTGEKDFLLVASRERQDAIGHIRGANLDAIFPLFTQCVLLRRIDELERGQPVERADGKIVQDTPERKCAIEVAVAGNEGDLAIACRQPVRAPRIIKIEQHLGLPMPGKTGKTDYLTLECMKWRDVVYTLGRGEDGFTRCIDIHDAARGFLALDAAHGFDEAVVGEITGWLVGNHLAILHHHDAVRGGEDFAQHMRNKDDRTACADETADIGHKLGRNPRIERRGWLIQNDQSGRRAGRGEIDGDFNHLPLGDGKFIDGGQAIDLVTGENFAELRGNECNGLAAPVSSLDIRLHDANVFRNGQVRE